MIIETLGLSLLGALLLGLPIVLIVATLHRRWRVAARQLALALLIPGGCVALWPHLLPPFHGARQILLLVLASVPLLMVPVLSKQAAMLHGQGRAAAGLGAGQAARLRLVWLPQLGPAGALGVLLAGLLDLAALLLHG